jgi:ABC-type branched-subunit amino acid transport system substrate-binding protein
MPRRRDRRPESAVVSRAALAAAVAIVACGPGPHVRGEARAEERAEAKTPGAGEAPGETEPTIAETEPPATEEGRRALAEADSALATGDRVLARRVLARLAREGAGALEAREARIRLAAEALARGDAEGARSWAEGLPASSFSRFRLEALAFEVERKPLDAAGAWIEALSRAPDDAATAEAAEGAARSFFLSGQHVAARETVDAHAVELGRLKDTLAREATPEGLADLQAALPDGDAWVPWVALERAKRACATADPAPCKEAAAAAVALGDGGTAAEAKALLDEATARAEVDPRAVGVLLPLSGDYQRIGEGALEALQLALADHPGVRLVVRDTKGDAETARAMARELAVTGKVAALLGPVGEKEARAAAEVAARYGVPQVLLTSAPEAARGLAGVFRARLSGADQAEALARHVVSALDVTRVALLWPDAAAAERASFAFWDEVERLGGEVRAAGSYRPGEKDFGPSLKALLGASTPGTGSFDFDGLLLPDDALSVRRLVPFLKYWDVHVRTAPDLRGTARRPAVQILGGAGWNHPSVIDRGDGLTDNAVFVDAWAHDPADPAGDAFARAFFERYRRKPSAFHAEVRDAAALLIEALRGVEARDHSARVAVREALASRGPFEGVGGPLVAAQEGRLERAPVLLTIEGDRIRPRLPEDEEAALRRAKDPTSRPGAPR